MSLKCVSLARQHRQANRLREALPASIDAFCNSITEAMASMIAKDSGLRSPVSEEYFLTCSYHYGSNWQGAFWYRFIIMVAIRFCSDIPMVSSTKRKPR